MVSPGSYTEVTVLGISHTLQATGEFVNLTSTAPAGITVSFTPASPVPVPATKSVNVTMLVQASLTASIGNDTITVTSNSGANTQTVSFTVRVVQNRIVMLRSAFIPSHFNVTAGSTIYWQNLDGPAGGCGSSSTGTGLHSVVFTTISGANSSAITQFGVYSYTFNTPGSYFYYSSLDTDHSMNGTINVVAANGGGGMMQVAMPAFSYFKVGSAPPAASATTTTTTTVANPVHAAAATSPLAAGGLAFAGLAFMNAHLTVLSGLGFGAVLAVLLGVAAVGLAVAMSAAGKRWLTILGAGIIERLSPSDSSR